MGKSMLASFLYQAFIHHGKTVQAYDTDPVNATFESFKEFEVTLISVMQDDNIDPRKFDVLLEALATAPEDAHVVIDNGSSSFIALGAYLSENDFLPLLKEHGHKVFFHTIVTGGQSMGDTLKGLARLAIGFPASPLVVWLNPFFGEIAMDNKTFEEFKVYKEYSGQFYAVITLPLGNKALIGKDLEELFAKRQSFTAGINSSSTSIAVKARLKKYWGQILTCVEQANLV